MTKKDLQRAGLIILVASVVIAALTVLIPPDVYEVEGQADYECVYGYPVKFITHNIPSDGTPLRGLTPWLFGITDSKLSPLPLLIDVWLIYMALTLLFTLSRLGFAYYKKLANKRRAS